MSPSEVSEHTVVEVSGWNDANDFFVFKTPLERSATGREVVYLPHTLRKGSVLFIRLSSAWPTPAGLPMAYEVLSVAQLHGEGLCVLELEPIPPRRT